MRIAILSDTHDNIWNLRETLMLVKEHRAEAIIHCGDFIAPFMLKELNEAKIPVHGVFGNNDGDKFLLTKLSLTSLSHITLYDPVGELNLEHFKVAFTHYKAVAEGLAATGRFDLVCFGHTHEASLDNVGGAYYGFVHAPAGNSASSARSRSAASSPESLGRIRSSTTAAG